MIGSFFFVFLNDQLLKMVWLSNIVDWFFLKGRWFR